MRCWTLLVNRNRARLIKKGSYESNQGSTRVGFRKSLNWQIPDDSIPFEVEKGRSSVPMWVVNEKTLTALSIRPRQNGAGHALEDGKEYIEVVEKTDPDAHTKMNLLIKRAFWKEVALKIKLSLVETAIYLGAGYGFLRLLEYVITSIFTGSAG